MAKVWIIEQGYYSDYSVLGIFSTEENARKVCDWINSTGPYDRAEVSERTLDPVVAYLNEGRRQWRVHMLRDGSTEYVEQQDSTYELEGVSNLWDRLKAPAFRGKNLPVVLTSTVWATDAGHAIKIVNERRIQMIASGEWNE